VPDMDTTIIFFGTLIYVIAILVGFFIISELRETNKHFRKILALFSHLAFLSASKDSSHRKAKKIKDSAFEILSDQFPDELDEVVAAQSRLRHRNGSTRKKYEEFEGLPLNDLL